MTAVFVGGIVSFLSPCVLPLVPGYVSYIAGQSMADSATSRALIVRVQALALSACFVLGFATIFVILGASATTLGQALISYRYELNLIGGLIVIVFGLFAIGLLRLSWLHRDLRFDIALPGGRPVAAYLLGMAFAFGWTPCIGPMLGAILTVRGLSHGCERDNASGDLFARTRRPVFAGGCVHGRFVGAVQVNRPCRPASSHLCRRSHGSNGDGHDYGSAFNIFVLAAGDLSATIDHRINDEKREILGRAVSILRA